MRQQLEEDQELETRMDTPKVISDDSRTASTNEAIRAENEVCICAAILTVEGKIIRGHRHHDCIAIAIKMRLTKPSGDAWQGFITSRNRYVDRYEGMRLQLDAGVASVSGYRGSTLFSEDLY